MFFAVLIIRKTIYELRMIIQIRQTNVLRVCLFSINPVALYVFSARQAPALSFANIFSSATLYGFKTYHPYRERYCGFIGLERYTPRERLLHLPSVSSKGLRAGVHHVSCFNHIIFFFATDTGISLYLSHRSRGVRLQYLAKHSAYAQSFLLSLTSNLIEFLCSPCF